MLSNFSSIFLLNAAYSSSCCALISVFCLALASSICFSTISSTLCCFSELLSSYFSSVCPLTPRSLSVWLPARYISSRVGQAFLQIFIEPFLFESFLNFILASLSILLAGFTLGPGWIFSWFTFTQESTPGRSSLLSCCSMHLVAVLAVGHLLLGSAFLQTIAVGFAACWR